uniref:C-type lectin domain-containing protein n=1 Tax=Haplochromis burtoni TaxID=8153 RepID=A0A3Q2VRH5_HAPBU
QHPGNDPCYKCEDGWKQHGEKCYFFSTSKSSWNESSTGCSTKGGDLVKIDTIQQKIESYDDLFWIGLTDSAVEGRWLWVDGSPLNERFDSAQLHYITLHTYEMYYMMGPMYWFAISCKVTHRSICEKPAVALCV